MVISDKQRVEAFLFELAKICKRYQVKIITTELYGSRIYKTDDENTAYCDEPQSPLKSDIWEIGPNG